MELTQLRYFIKAAKLKHITNAALELHIAQPALTKSIHKLEEELGVPLFYKNGRGVDLTEYGELLATEGESILAQIDDLPHKISEMKDKNHRTVKIRMTAASTIVTGAIIEYSKLHPDIIFNVSQDADSLSDDIFVYSSVSNDLESTDDIYSIRERIFAAVPANIEKYAERTSVSLAELSEEKFVCLMGSLQLRSICDNYCKIAGFVPNIIFESDNPSSVRNMIAARVGIGFWPEYSWGNARSQTDGLHLLEITDPRCTRYIHVACSKESSRNEHTQSFYVFLKDYFEKNFR